METERRRMSSVRLTFKSYNKEKADNNLKPSQSFPVHRPPKPVLVRLSKVAFQFSVVANLALSAYIFVRSKQKMKRRGFQVSGGQVVLRALAQL